MLSSSDMRNADRSTKLNIKLTNKKICIHGRWNKEKLLSLLKNKFLQYYKVKCSSGTLHAIIHSGIYNEYILQELEKRGMSPCNIVKVMKYGLVSLIPEELKYFESFGVEMNIINDTEMWTKNLDHILIWNLLITGLSEIQCWTIVMRGLISQNENILYRILASGVDVPGILDWQNQIKSVTPIMIRFLKKLGIDEDILRYVEENGIDDEIENMLIDFGYNTYKEKEVSEIFEETLHEDNLTILEPCSNSKEKKLIDISNDNSSLKIKESYFYGLNNIIFSLNISMFQRDIVPLICICSNLLPKKEKSVERDDYLRQNVMVPLSWAISKTLKYRPSNPEHYIAYQLLRWKYGNVPQSEIYNARKFMACAKIIDGKLMV